MLVVLRLRGIRCRYKLLKTEPLEVLGEESREVAPLRVVARKEHRLISKDVGVIVDVGVHLRLNVVELRIELVVLGVLRSRKIFVCHSISSP